MRSSFPIFTVAAVVVGALVIAGYFLIKKDPASIIVEQPLQQPASEVETPADGMMGDTAPSVEPVSKPDSKLPGSGEQQPEPAPQYDLVQPPENLNESDSIVRKALVELSPKLSQWLIPEEQVRKWVLAVDQMADGQLPKRYRPVIYPMDKFKAKEYGDLSVMEDANYERLKPLIETVTAIEPALLAAYYQSWKPLLEKAYSQQGEPGTFEERLILAIDRFSQVKPLGEKALLVRPHVFYVYKEEDLEKASDLEKLAWRMGEDNRRELQAYALEFRRAIIKQ